MRTARSLIISLLLITIVSFSFPFIVRLASVSYFFSTPAQVGQLYDDKNNPIAKLGTVAQFNYNRSSSDPHPQFYAALESHTADKNFEGIANLHITITATDPTGAGIVANQYLTPNPSYLLVGPDSNTANQQQILVLIYKAILNAIPFGLGTDIQNAVATTQTQPKPIDSNTAALWGDYSAGVPCCAFVYGPQDKSIDLGFQLQVSSTRQGTYLIHITYHADVDYCHVLDPSTGNCIDIDGLKHSTVNLSDTLYYCYVICTQDFSISSNPTSLMVNGGSSGNTSTISLGSLNSFSGPVSLSATASDLSLQSSFSPPTVTVPSAGSAQSTITVIAPTTTCKPGSFNVAVTAGQHGIDHTINIPVTETCPADFAISLNPTSLSICHGNSALSSIMVQSYSGFSGSVSFSTSSSPSGLYAAWTISGSVVLSAGGSATNTLGVQTYQSPTGQYNVIVTGTSGSLSHSSSVAVTVYGQCPGGATAEVGSPKDL